MFLSRPNNTQRNVLCHYPVNAINCDLKNLIFCALLFSFTTSFAQIKLEAQIGYNDANLSNIGRLPFKDYQYYSSINFFQAGAGAEIPLGKKWFLEPTLLYFGNGSHISEQTFNPGIDWDLKVDVRLYYLRIPVNFIIRLILVNHFMSLREPDYILQEDYGARKMDK